MLLSDRTLDVLWPETSQYLLDDMDSMDSLDDLLYSSLHSDDMWKKFEFLDVPVTVPDLTPSSPVTLPEDSDNQLDTLLEWSLDATSSSASKDVSEIRHHDCMWAGHCGSKEHRSETAKPVTAIIFPTPRPAPINPTNVIRNKLNTQVQMPNSGRSLLLRNAVAATPVSKHAPGSTVLQTVLPQAAVGHVGPRPDSPPSSDDDDHPRFKHEMAGIFSTSVNKTLQLLNDAISECDFDEDSDLCEYFEDSSDMFAETESSGDGPRAYPGESDHSYHKGKGMQHKMDYLGVQTPSDSGKFSLMFCTFFLTVNLQPLHMLLEF